MITPGLLALYLANVADCRMLHSSEHAAAVMTLVRLVRTRCACRVYANAVQLMRCLQYRNTQVSAEGKE